MYKLIFPIAAVAISLASCFIKLVSTPVSGAYHNSESSTRSIDALMFNKNKGMDGQKYSKVLSACDFSYTGWKRNK